MITAVGVLFGAFLGQISAVAAAQTVVVPSPLSVQLKRVDDLLVLAEARVAGDEGQTQSRTRAAVCPPEFSPQWLAKTKPDLIIQEAKDEYVKYHICQAIATGNPGACDDLSWMKTTPPPPMAYITESVACRQHAYTELTAVHVMAGKTVPPDFCRRMASDEARGVKPAAREPFCSFLTSLTPASLRNPDGVCLKLENILGGSAESRKACPRGVRSMMGEAGVCPSFAADPADPIRKELCESNAAARQAQALRNPGACRGLPFCLALLKQPASCEGLLSSLKRRTCPKLPGSVGDLLIRAHALVLVIDGSLRGGSLEAFQQLEEREERIARLTHRYNILLKAEPVKQKT